MASRMPFRAARKVRHLHTYAGTGNVTSMAVYAGTSSVTSTAVIGCLAYISGGMHALLFQKRILGMWGLCGMWVLCGSTWLHHLLWEDVGRIYLGFWMLCTFDMTLWPSHF